MTEEVLGTKPLHLLERLKLGVTRIAVVALVVIIIVGGVVGAYVALRPPSSSSSPIATSSPSISPSSTPITTPTLSPTPTPTPTSAPTPTPSPTLSHVVPWQEMANYTTDYWNATVKNPYTVLLNDSMTVSSGNQWLTITAYSGSSTIWSVQFVNSTYFRYSNVNDYGFLNCNDGIVYVTENDTAITYKGTTSYTSSPSGVNFPSLVQIQTENGDGNFNSGILNISTR